MKGASRSTKKQILVRMLEGHFLLLRRFWRKIQETSITFQPIVDFDEIILRIVRCLDGIVRRHGTRPLPVAGLALGFGRYIECHPIAHARARRHLQRHFRRRAPHCSGTLVWQLNDCWPAVSWSAIECVSEIAPLLIVIRLSEFRYADATAIAVVMLLAAFLIIPLVALYEFFTQVVPKAASEGTITAASFTGFDSWMRWLPPMISP